MYFRIILFFGLTIFLLPGVTGCARSHDPGPGAAENKDTVISFYITRGDQLALLKRQTGTLSFGTNSNSYSTIVVDSSQHFQEVDGFGYTLTGGSAWLINRMDPSARGQLLQELFGQGENGLAIPFLRISIGSSDLNAAVYSYDDVPAGQTDSGLRSFSLGQDTIDLIPTLRQILAINPRIKLLGSPWSAPVWMKDNGNSVGGSLLPQYYEVYARYFVRYIQAMKSEGIPVYAITPQNEPLYGGNNPSMLMTAAQQADFIKKYLGPAFQKAGIFTRIIVYDHNCDRPDYPMAVLNDAAARPFVDGSAFHLYAGDISALGTVHSAYPEKNLYFTEQWTGANGSFEGDFLWHTRNVIIGSMRNWSRLALEWNLANGPGYQPHTPGGCSECKGALTIDGSAVSRNVSYYIIGQASKWIPPGSVRIASNTIGNLSDVAFVRPDGMKVLLVLNEGTSDANFNIRYKNKWVTTVLPPKSTGTYVW